MGRAVSAASGDGVRDRVAPWTLGVVLVAATLALLATAPVNGDFWWPDAPHHALNGLFLHDFSATHPFPDPVGWAEAYHLHRPGLTMLFYPPLFYAIEAVAFALFGFSRLVAQACVAAFVLLLGGAAYWLALCCLPRWSALGAALLAIGMPEAAFWGRQVMLDVPAYALAVTSVCFTMGYVRSGRAVRIYLAAVGGLLIAVAPVSDASKIASIANRKPAWRTSLSRFAPIIIEFAACYLISKIVPCHT